MNRFLCSRCGAAFSAPLVRQYRAVRGGVLFREELCPACAGEDIAPAEPCPVCGAPKDRREALCRDCRRALLARFFAFRDRLSPAECSALDAFLDGESIAEAGRSALRKGEMG